MKKIFSLFLTGTVAASSLLLTGCIEETLPTSGATQDQIDGSLAAKAALLWGMPAYANSLEVSTDGGETWTRVMCANNKDAAEVAAQTTSTCYWNLKLNNHTPAQFRIAMTGGNKNVAAYVDNFTLYYTGEEGGPIEDIPGDVNGDIEVNVADINTVIDMILGGTADEDTIRRADVNGDGEINIADVNAVIDKILN